MYENPPKLQDIGLTPFAKAMPNCYQYEDAVKSYREYYAYKTTYMKVVWAKLSDKIPNWWTNDFVSETVESYTPNPA
jgi:hypothetical protein